MFGSHSMGWLIFLTCGALTALGCATETEPSETGALSLELVLADGVTVDTVEWRITGNRMDMS